MFVRSSGNVFAVCFWSVLHLIGASPKKPHIIFMIADDLGWNDVGYHGSDQIPTPNIDALAYHGIALERHYTLPTCTPSRTAFLTGKYPIRMGMQGKPIIAGSPVGIPLNETLLPEYLQRLGYTTRLIGKWHVGCRSENFTPTRRGYHSHLGYFNGFLDYYNAIHESEGRIGYDSYRDLKKNHQETQGRYLTRAYTEEAVNIIRNHDKSSPLFLQISHLAVHTGKALVLDVEDKQKNKEQFGYISNPSRQLYAGVLQSLDESVGKVVKALEKANILSNSIVVFISDNGGPTIDPAWNHNNSASNWPLRGLKGSQFEGGVRGVAAVWSSLFQQRGRVSDSYFHISDWLPTLYAAAGGNDSDLDGLDGINQWDYLINDKLLKPRSQFLINYDEKEENFAFVKNEWKIIRANKHCELNFTHFYLGESGQDGGDYRISDVVNSDVSKALQKYITPDNQDLTEEFLELRNSIRAKKEKLCKDRILYANFTEPYVINDDPVVDRCESPCLYNIVEDPCEFENVAHQNPSIVKDLLASIEIYKSEIVPQQDNGIDPASNPDFWGGYWVPWLDYMDSCNADGSHCQLSDKPTIFV